MIGYKALNTDFTCLSHQFEVGKTYEIEGEPILCERGFHFCDNPLLVKNFYFGSCRYARIKAEGIIKDNKHIENEVVKYVTNKITILSEIKEEDYQKLYTKEMCLDAIKQYKYLLVFVPENIIDKEICLFAVKQNGFMLQFVPRYILDKEICLSAVRENGNALRLIPKNIIDSEICLIACIQNENALEFVPENIRDNKEIYYYTQNRPRIQLLL